MKLTDPNLSTAGSAGAARANETARANAANRAGTSGGSNAASNDDVHLSELVRTLRSLAAESPERQARIEHLTRAYASGHYRIDPEATASGIIQDSLIQDSRSDSRSPGSKNRDSGSDSIHRSGSTGGGTIEA